MHLVRDYQSNGNEICYHCITCGLKFGVCAVVDQDIADGKPYVVNCPRCMSNQVRRITQEGSLDAQVSG